MNDICVKCGKDKVTDYPECHIIENELPQLLEIQDSGWKLVIEDAFRFVHQMRCEFMHWLIRQGFAVQGPDELYQLPSVIEMRPEAMRAMEEEILTIVTSNRQAETNGLGKKKLHALLAEYRTRSAKFFANQQIALIGDSAE